MSDHRDEDAVVDEFQCPNCHKTIRARMSDGPLTEVSDEAVTATGDAMPGEARSRSDRAVSAAQDFADFVYLVRSRLDLDASEGCAPITEKAYRELPDPVLARTDELITKWGL